MYAIDMPEWLRYKMPTSRPLFLLSPPISLSPRIQHGITERERGITIDHSTQRGGTAKEEGPIRGVSIPHWLRYFPLHTIFSLHFSLSKVFNL